MKNPNENARTATTIVAQPAADCKPAAPLPVWKDTFQFRLAAAEAAAKNPDSDSAARAYLQLAAAIANSVLRRAYDPSRTNAAKKAAARAAEAAALDVDEAAEAAAYFVLPEAKKEDMDNTGAQSVLAYLRASLPADMDSITSILSAEAEVRKG